MVSAEREHEREFPPDAASAAAARRFVLEVVDVDPATADSLRLAVSEMATNAILHGRSNFVVRVAVGDGTLRVGVFDENPQLPVRKHYGADAVTGRGLSIIDQLVSSWGTDAVEDGKWVWIELVLDRQLVR